MSEPVFHPHIISGSLGMFIYVHHSDGAVKGLLTAVAVKMKNDPLHFSRFTVVIQLTHVPVGNDFPLERNLSKLQTVCQKAKSFASSSPPITVTFRPSVGLSALMTNVRTPTEGQTTHHVNNKNSSRI